MRDSLTQLLATSTRRDTLRAGRPNALSFLLRTNEAPQSLRLARQALALDQQLSFSKGLLDAHFNMGYYYRAHNQHDSAICYTRQALALAVRTYSQYNQTRAYYNLARIYTEQGNYAAALAPSLDGLALARLLHNPRAKLFQLLQAGVIELALGEYDAAHDHLGTGYAYTLLGDLNRQQSHLAAARRYYLQAATSYQVVYNDCGLLPTELSIAEMTEHLGEHPAARPDAYGLLRRARTTGTPKQAARAALLLARTWLAAHPDSARRYAVLALATARPPCAPKCAMRRLC